MEDGIGSIERIVAAAQAASALAQTTFEILPSEQGKNPHPIIVKKTIDDNGDTRIQHEEMSGWSPRAQRKTGTINVKNPQSFIGYVNRHKTSFTEIFKPGPLDFLCAFDSFESGDSGYAGHMEHHCRLNLTQSKDCARWAGQLSFDQVGLASFLEDMDHTIIAPNAADIADIILNLKGSTDVKWKSQKNLANGDVQIQYEENSTMNDMVVPSKIHVAVNIFEGMPPQDFQAALRFRINRENGRITFVLKVLGLEQAIDEAADAVREMIVKDTELEVFH
jgi:uncharacterized protein YfdQ (DUF2303 family)